MSTNLYQRSPHLYLRPGEFWRCRHGRTLLTPCWRCGWFHPWRYLRGKLREMV